MIVLVIKKFLDLKEDSALRLPSQLLYLDQKRAEELIKGGFVKSLEEAEQAEEEKKTKQAEEEKKTKQAEEEKKTKK